MRLTSLLLMLALKQEPKTLNPFQVIVNGRRGGLMASALDSGSGGPGSSPRQGTAWGFLGQDTLLS